MMYSVNKNVKCDITEKRSRTHSAIFYMTLLSTSSVPIQIWNRLCICCKNILLKQSYRKLYLHDNHRLPFLHQHLIPECGVKNMLQNTQEIAKLVGITFYVGKDTYQCIIDSCMFWVSFMLLWIPKIPFMKINWPLHVISGLHDGNVKCCDWENTNSKNGANLCWVSRHHT